MTLCIAWKSKKNVHIASDSRLTIKKDGAANFVDIGIKVFSVPVTIYTPTDSITGQKAIIYKHSVGLCFAGYTTNAYVVKESIYEVLQNLQCSPYSEFSFFGICNLILKFYEHTSRKLCEIMRQDGVADFIISGYCPEKNSIRSFKFTLNTDDFPVKGVCEEVLINEGDIVPLGSGKGRFVELLPIKSPIHSLKKVINDEQTKDVGGSIQYGDFDENHNFIVKGIRDYEITDGYLRTKLVIRGSEMYENDILLSDDDLHISYTYINPFSDEINDFLNTTQ